MTTILRPCLTRTSRTSGIRQPCFVRPFHASRPTHFVDTGVIAAHEVLQGVHSITGLPWVLSIPLTSLLVRLCTAVPLAAYSKYNANKQQEVLPLIQAWRETLRAQVKRFEAQRKIRLGPVAAEREVRRALKEEQRAIYKRMGISRWGHLIAILQLPVWLCFMDALRRMSGMESIIESFKKWARARFWGTSPELGEASTTAQTAENPVPLVPIEPTFATEGALWFPDLTVLDPHLVLPFVMSAAMLLSVNVGKKPIDLATMARLSGAARVQVRFGNALRLFLNAFALCLGPLSIAAGFPSSIMVYWIAGSLLATIQTPLIKRMFPSKPQILPCIPKGIRMKSKVGPEADKKI